MRAKLNIKYARVLLTDLPDKKDQRIEKYRLPHVPSPSIFNIRTWIFSFLSEMSCAYLTAMREKWSYRETDL